jgi:hypothetical protein
LVGHSLYQKDKFEKDSGFYHVKTIYGKYWKCDEGAGTTLVTTSDMKGDDYKLSWFQFIEHDDKLVIYAPHT